MDVALGGVVDEAVADDLASGGGGFLGRIAVRGAIGIDVFGIGRGVHVRVLVVLVVVVVRGGTHLGPAGSLELAGLLGGLLVPGRWIGVVDGHGVIAGFRIDVHGLGYRRVVDIDLGTVGISDVRLRWALRRARGRERAGDLLVGRDARGGGAALRGRARVRRGVRTHRARCMPRSERVRRRDLGAPVPCGGSRFTGSETAFLNIHF